MQAGDSFDLLSILTDRGISLPITITSIWLWDHAQVIKICLCRSIKILFKSRFGRVDDRMVG